MSPAKFSLIFIVLITVLVWRFAEFYQASVDYQNGQIINLQVVLQEEPAISNRGQKFMVKNDQNQRFYINSSLNTLYHYGDRLAIEGKLQVSKNAKDFTFYNLNYPKIISLPRSQNPLIAVSLVVRERSTRLFRETLPQNSASLLCGIVF